MWTYQGNFILLLSVCTPFTSTSYVYMIITYTIMFIIIGDENDMNQWLLIKIIIWRSIEKTRKIKNRTRIKNNKLDVWWVFFDNRLHITFALIIHQLPIIVNKLARQLQAKNNLIFDNQMSCVNSAVPNSSWSTLYGSFSVKVTVK